jgi:DNA-binding XRE family transcriptional regulator
MAGAASKYQPLQVHLRQSGADELTLNFAEIERILGERLPKSARSLRGWWSNRGEGAVQAQAWMGAGYHTVDLDLDAEQVTFRKPGLVYQVDRQGDIVLWNADLIKALRHHLNMTQAELAEKLAVRQSTISEWERGVYEPTRSTSKFLTMVAEASGFSYE